MEIDHDIPRLPVDTESYKFNGDWDIVYHKSHILKSMCTNNHKCIKDDPGCCELCCYEFKLELPHLPEMVFSKNNLVLTHKNGARIEFNPLDALARVKNGKSSIRVACADEWKSSRDDAANMQEIKPFDWSFTTDYQGTYNDKIRCEDTDAKLNIFKLMQKERILFYHDLSLFEDELHDHGIAACSVKIRVMPSGFFILLSYFLRVDGVLIRMNGTRFHYEIGNNYILKEYTSREAKFESIKHLPPAIYTTPSEIEKHLTITLKKTQKLFFD
ncbi:TIP41-like protein [Contarinia nasturtii]|uniref:TIP41-like protein n=1 Tax=Contarinia nasturtii TaxID=265458 RepID=UPI0012D49982|nr:TIP41-like protein [Contarinia nasturtii]